MKSKKWTLKKCTGLVFLIGLVLFYCFTGKTASSGNELKDGGDYFMVTLKNNTHHVLFQRTLHLSEIPVPLVVVWNDEKKPDGHLPEFSEMTSTMVENPPSLLLWPGDEVRFRVNRGSVLCALGSGKSRDGMQRFHFESRFDGVLFRTPDLTIRADGKWDPEKTEGGYFPELTGEKTVKGTLFEQDKKTACL